MFFIISCNLPDQFSFAGSRRLNLDPAEATVRPIRDGGGFLQRCEANDRELQDLQRRAQQILALGFTDGRNSGFLTEKTFWRAGSGSLISPLKALGPSHDNKNARKDPKRATIARALGTTHFRAETGPDSPLLSPPRVEGRAGGPGPRHNYFFKKEAIHSQII